MDSASVGLSPHSIGCIEAADHVRLSYRMWEGSPAGAVVVYLHGIEGHGQWFEPTALHLQRQGLTVYALDRRGAGLNQENRGHLGDYRQLFLDVAALIELIEKTHAGHSLFYVGNCWGARMAILLSLPNSGLRQPSGLILTSPALGVKVDVDALTKLKIGIGWLVGSRKKFSIPLTEEMFTDNKKFLTYIRRDDLRLLAATGSFFVESLKLERLAQRSAGQLTVPLLILQAGEDDIVSVDAVRSWFNLAGSDDKTLRIFPHAKHSLDFDLNHPEYRDVLSDWVHQHMAVFG